MYRVQYIVKHLIFYKHTSIRVAGIIFTGDPTPFDLVDIDVNLRRLHTQRAKIGCKDCKVSLRDEKPSYACFKHKA